MSKVITLRKGLDINLEGKPQPTVADAPRAAEYAVSPLDFEGVTPKLLVKAGDKVKAGTPLFFNKNDQRVLFTSPVSGCVAAINRGEKRKVLSVTVTPDGEGRSEEFGRPDLGAASREEVVELLLRSGLWPMIVQRPYGIIADPSDTPRAIFVSAFDSAPLAPDYNFVLREEKHNLQTGIEVLRKLTAQGFIDDARYAGAFVRDKIRLAGWGARKIRTALRAKGVADAAIDAALAETDDPEGRGARLRTRLERKLRTVRAADPYDLRNKLLRHALSLGYDYAESAAAVAELTETPEIPCDDF